ncbi:thioredoxin-like domain-containing protein [Carboxylicivirga caseinilyticus]|uniref:thioredoxin-like domain-containing protein n=1 Tax=Carboxylicivirga caseinilyticus TaxID=3417572 RepID=UPI003D33B4A8|nr:redoxin domain-containing protein [Marinilabiliaceae bacterium A049]
MRNILLLFTLIISSYTYSQSCKIDIQINEFNKDTIILGYYFNKQMFVEDTIPANSSGRFLIDKKEPIKQGVYIVYLNSDQYFDVLIGEDQTFSIKTSTDDLLANLEIKGSDESVNFLDYQKFLRNKQLEAKSIQDKLKETTDEGEKKDLSSKLQGFGDEVKQKAIKTIQNNPNTFLALFLKGIQEIDVPEMEAPAGSANPEQEVQRMRFNYYKAHYFDNLDLSDSRLLRTPYFTEKIDRYLSQVLVIPDTIMIGCHKMIAAAEGNPEMEKYLIQYLFNWANESKTMGMDAVMVDMADAYYLNGRADWVDEEFLTKLRERVDKIKPTLLNKVAADFKMQSYNEQHFRLSEIRAPFTILVFWEPECGHCKKEIPKLYEEVWQKYADKGIKIVAVYTQNNKEEWVDFITEHQLEEWIHLYDPYNQSGYRNNYDIYSTPVIYILDKDKKILAKRLGVEQIPGFLDHHFNNL